MKKRALLTLPILFTLLMNTACQVINKPAPVQEAAPTAAAPQQIASTAAQPQSPTQPPAPTTSLSMAQPAATDPNEPVSISGDIPYTSPFFLSSSYEPFVLLEDEAGFVKRDHQFTFPLDDQIIGPAIVGADKKLTYFLQLPENPHGTIVDAAHENQPGKGVMVFVVAYWSNTWNGPFLEERDGTGWSDAYASDITDPNRKDEIMGGTMVVWSPDDQQKFPTGFGADNKLFTADDPVGPIPAGYTLVNLDQKPFRFYKEAQPKLTLNEGVVAVNDYSKMNYGDAFKAMIDKVAVEYPFTTEKKMDWAAIKADLLPKAQAASNTADFYKVLRDFTYTFSDAHVGVSLDRDVFMQEDGGGVGLVLTQLTDGTVIVTDVLAGDPGEKAGIQKGAQIITWDGKPVADAINQAKPYFSPFSTEHTKHLAQVNAITRGPVGTQFTVSYKNPGQAQPTDTTLTTISEIQSLLKTLRSSNDNALSLPVEGSVLPDSNLGYIRISSFNDDTNLTAHLWDRDIQNMIDNKVPGLIIDLRSNGGGDLGLAMNFAGYFFNKEKTLYDTLYYNTVSGKFEPSDVPAKIKPAPYYYDGPIAVLVSPDCVSACEGFAYALQQDGRSTVVGFYPSAGGFGEVGRGQYSLPDGFSMQFPTGKSISPDGKLVLEGVGVVPDITVPVTLDSALGTKDTLLDAAVQALLKKTQ